MRLKFIPTIEMFPMMEKLKSSQKGTFVFEDVYPSVYEMNPTRAITRKWRPINAVVALEKDVNEFYYGIIFDKMLWTTCKKKHTKSNN